MKALTIHEIAELVGGSVSHLPHHLIHGCSGLKEANANQLAFYQDTRYQKQLFSSQAGCILVPDTFDLAISNPVIRVPHPYQAFILMLSQFNRFQSLTKVGREEPVFISPTSQLGTDCYFGAFAYIGAGTHLGDRVKVYPQVYIGEEVTIGSNTVIFPGAKILSGAKIGAYCTIQSGAVIGSAGFGYLPDTSGNLQAIPQIGNVILEDHVDIGANTTIDCATVDSTVIRMGTKIDNLVHVGHNVEIGKNTVIAAQVGISGSTRIGSGVTLAGQVGVAGHIEVADGTKAGGKSGITKSVRQKGTVLSGTFAFEHDRNKKAYAMYKMLPDTMDRIKALEEKWLTLLSSKE